MSHSSFLAGEPDLYAASFEPLPGTVPFADAESAWFWCVETSDAIHGGARLRAGMGSTPRPCEAVDIQKIVIRLNHDRILSDKHIDAMVRYGQRQTRPVRMPDTHVWQQAMARLTPALQRKGIITP